MTLSKEVSPRGGLNWETSPAVLVVVSAEENGQSKEGLIFRSRPEERTPIRQRLSRSLKGFSGACSMDHQGKIFQKNKSAGAKALR